MFLSWRIAFISIATIAASLVAAALVLFAFDVTVNAMIVAGLVAALVVVIDDAIIGAWGSARDARTDAPDETHVVPGIIDSILRLRSVALYAAVIMVAAMLPVIVMQGEAAAFLRPIVQAYLLAIAAALVVSITVAPALSVLLLAGHANLSGHTRFTGWLTGWYRGFAARFIAKTTTLVVFGVFMIGGVVALLFINVSLRPDLNERDIVVQLEAAPGTALPTMVAITELVVDDLQAQSGVANVTAHIGRAISSDKVVNVNSAEVWINIEPTADYDATLIAIDSVVDGASDVNAVVATYSDQRVTAILDRTDDELVVRVYGEDPLIRQDAAEQIQRAMSEIDGVDDPRIAVVVVEPTIEIEVDLERAQAFGVKPGDVRRQAATLVSGLVVGNLFEDQKVFDVVVWGIPGIRGTIDDVRTLAIATPSGDDVALGDLADVRVVPNPTVIEREAVATYLDVTAGVTGRSLRAAANDIDARLAEIQLPLDHHAEVLGGFQEASDTRFRVYTAAIAALILIYLLLQSAFGSWRLASLAFLALPMGISGSLIVIALTGGVATLGSIAGMIAIFGLATRGVVLTIRTYRDRLRLGDTFDHDLVIGRTAHLVVPLTISAIAIAVVFLPLLIAGSRPGLEIAGSMAAAVLGGLVTTVLLTVVVIPAAYLRWGYVEGAVSTQDELFDDEPAVTTVGS
jgi:Cu/Ag efflux pump CusA